MKTKQLSENAKKILKVLDRYKYILIVVLAGLILLILPSGSDKTVSTETDDGGMQEEIFDVSALEEKLEQALAEVEGVGKVKVILTLKAGSERILATDKNVSYKSGRQGEVTDYDMDSQESTVVISSGSGTQEAIVVKRLYPEYLGAFIVCEGGGSSAVRLMVTEAVSALTGLGSDKIRVSKMS